MCKRRLRERTSKIESERDREKGKEQATCHLNVIGFLIAIVSARGIM